MPLHVDLASELADWPDVDFTLAASKEPTKYDREQLERLLVGWYDVGFYGGYGPSDEPNGTGRLHGMTDPVYHVGDENFCVIWRVDMGSAPDRALDALIRSLDGWSDSAHVPDATLRIR